MRRKLVCFIFWNVITVSMTGVEFEYSQEGQNLWAKHYPNCGGFSQSPISLAASRSIALPLPALEMVGYHDSLEPPVIVRNNGHSVMLRFNNELPGKQVPNIFGALLHNNVYELESLHFHWGLKNSRGSEHILHGIRFSLEMHLVHRNTKYPTIDKALLHDDGLAVVAVFFQVVEDENRLLQRLLNHLPEVQLVNTQTQLNESLILSWMLPRDRDTYYTYKGSLTTPPCSEVVTWIVLANPVPISYKQMNKFRLLSTGKTIQGDNYRHQQDVGNRIVYVRRTHPDFIDDNEANGLDSYALRWHWT